MKNFSAKYIGLTGGILMIITSLVAFYGFHLPETGAVKYVCFTIYIAAIILTLFRYRSNAGEKSFKDYFSEGFKTFVVITLIMAIYTVVFYKINPQIINNAMLEINKYNSADTSKTPAEVLENGRQFKNVFIPMTVATTTIMYLILGALVTSIGAGLLSQKNNTQQVSKFG